MTAAPPQARVRLCALTDLVPERGAVALVDGAQVALIRTHDDEVHGIANLDPYSGAHVVARGLVNYTSGELPHLMGRSTKELAAEIGPQYEREVIHRDHLALL